MSSEGLARAARAAVGDGSIDRDRLHRGIGRLRRAAHRRWTLRLGAPATVRGPEHPTLHFRPATGGWHLEVDGRWYAPERAEDQARLLALLPVHVIDERDLTSSGSHGGTVRVAGDGGDTLELRSVYGEAVATFVDTVPGRPAVSVDWIDGCHPDGWVETRARLHLDGARTCWMGVRLPRDLDGDKHLAVQVTRGRHTRVDVHRISRREPTRVPIHVGPEPARDLRVSLTTSSAEPVDDQRSLGFLLSYLDTTE